MANERRPWFKVFAQSYLRDVDLMGCSWEAEGLHARMMSLSWMSEIPGYLMVGHRPMTVTDLARAKWGIRITEEDIAKTDGLVKELESLHRIKWDEIRKCWFIPKMVKIYADQKTFTAYGKRGGNPKLKKGDNDA